MDSKYAPLVESPSTSGLCESAKRVREMRRPPLLRGDKPLVESDSISGLSESIRNPVIQSTASDARNIPFLQSTASDAMRNAIQLREHIEESHPNEEWKDMVCFHCAWVEAKERLHQAQLKFCAHMKEMQDANGRKRSMVSTYMTMKKEVAEESDACKGMRRCFEGKLDKWLDSIHYFEKDVVYDLIEHDVSFTMDKLERILFTHLAMMDWARNRQRRNPAFTYFRDHVPTKR